MNPIEANRLPAMKTGPDGRAAVDLAAMLHLAWPMVVNASIQTLLNLTDTAFVARISTSAVAGIAAVYWFIIGTVHLFAGVGMAVQPFAAQAVGSGRWRRATSAAWTGHWAALCLMPLFALIAWLGSGLIPHLGLDAEVTREAQAFWTPRIAVGALAVVQMAQQAFFYGVGHTRTSLAINGLVLVCNALFNALFILVLDWGVAGSAWATNLSMLVGCIVGAVVMWNAEPYRTQMAVRRTWRPRMRSAMAMIRVGLPIGFSIAFDMLGLALFQLMMTRVGVVAGAATQWVMMLTSIAYMPGVGLGSAGTTLVGQSIGAGDPQWAWKVGNRVIVVAAGYMGVVGFVIAALGPWLLPLLMGQADAQAAETASVAGGLLWIAAWYQLFDGVNLGCGFCLRGAGDTRFAAIALLALSWLVFLPLAHVFTFRTGEGPLAFLPGIGAGVAGGWWGATCYVTLLGLTLGARWLSRRWMRMKLAT